MNCTYCDLSKTATHSLVPFRGQWSRPKLMFVGIGPGQAEDREGRCFAGPSGELLDEVLRNLNIPADAVAYDNVVHCWPRDVYGQTRDPDETEILTCAPYLYSMIRATDPEIIVPLGTLAYRTLTGLKEAYITEEHGQSDEFRLCGRDRTIIGTYHPSAALRQQKLRGVPHSYLDAIYRDVKYAWDHAIGEYFLPKNRVINDPDEAVAYIEYLVELYQKGYIQFVALDTEGPQIQIKNAEKRKLGIEVQSSDLWNPLKKTVGVSLSYIPPDCKHFRDVEGVFIPMCHPESAMFDEHAYQRVSWALKWAFDKHGKVQIPVSFHNQKYDDTWCREKHDFTAVCYHDTMLGSFVYHGQSISHGLGIVAHKLLKFKRYKDGPGDYLLTLPLDQRSFYNVPLNILGPYAGIDAAATACLTVLEKELLRRSNQETVMAVLNEGTMNFADIEHRGAAIDFEKHQHHMQNYPKMMEEAANEVLELPMVQAYIQDRQTIWTFDKKGKPRPPDKKFKLNLNSPDHRYDLLYRYYNFPIEYAEETKASQDHEDDDDYQAVYSTNENSRHMMTLHVRDEKYEGKCTCRCYVPGWDTFGSDPEGNRWRTWDYYHPVNLLHYGIDPHAEGYKFLIKIRFWGKLRKVLNDYLKKIEQYFRPEEWHQRNNIAPNIRIINNNYILHWVKTGRLCTRDFAVHTVPWHSDPRRLFVSRWKNQGGLMLSADYSQLELRVAAAIGKDQKLIQVYRDGKDVHRVTASKVYKVPENEVTQAMRRYSKTMSFRLIYGGGAQAIADETGLTKKEAQQMIDAFLAEYTGIAQSIKDFHNHVQKFGFVWTPMRRIFYLPDIYSENKSKQAGALRDSQNYPIQSSSSDVTMTAINFVCRELRNTSMQSYIWAMIHDAIETDLYPGELFSYYTILKNAMEKQVCEAYDWLCVPMVAEFELGTRWDGALTVKDFDKEHMVLKGRRGFYDETMDVMSRGYNFDVKIKKEVYIGTHKPCKGDGEVDAVTKVCKKCKQVVNPDTDLDYGETLILRKSYEGESGGNTEVTCEVAWRQYMEAAA